MRRLVTRCAALAVNSAAWAAFGIASLDHYGPSHAVEWPAAAVGALASVWLTADFTRRQPPDDGS